MNDLNSKMKMNDWMNWIEVKWKQDEWIPRRTKHRSFCLQLQYPAVIPLVAWLSHVTHELGAVSSITEQPARLSEYFWVPGCRKNTWATICNTQSITHITLKSSGENRHPARFYCKDPIFLLVSYSWFMLDILGQRCIIKAGERNTAIFFSLLHSTSHH